MDTQALIQAISAKDVDIERFVQLVIEDGAARDEIIRLLTIHPDIMVYYPCYYVVDRASQERPALFYPYWPEIAALLQHPNSYHRDIALTVLANLTQVDTEGRFAHIAPDYFAHIHDAKFMTGLCCVRNWLKIFRNQPAFRNEIITRLLDVDRQCMYTAKQVELMKADILEIFAAVYAEAEDQPEIDRFIQACLSSASPKTRRKAKELAGKPH